MNNLIKHVSPDDIILELNERARSYHRSGLSIEDAVRQTVTDWVHHLKGVGYRILSEEEVMQHGFNTFFEPYGVQS